MSNPALNSFYKKPILVFESHPAKYIKIVKLGSIYASMVTSSMTAVLGIGTNLGIPSLMAVEAPIIGLVLATFASLSSSSLLYFAFRPFASKIILEQNDQVTNAIENKTAHSDINTIDAKKPSQNITKEGKADTKPLESEEKKLPNFKNIHKATIAAFKKQNNIDSKIINTQYSPGASEELEDTVTVGPYNINNTKQFILLNKYTKLSILTPTLSGVNYVTTKVQISDIRLAPGNQYFKNWYIVSNDSHVHPSDKIPTEKTIFKSLTALFKKKFQKKLVEFTVMPNFSLNKQEQQVMSQIIKLIGLNSKK
ncbi:hypothetical protein BB561_003770 [Smittium simulii]|uniref:Uncharacterized protein n=1 Tax=Smittium simulii TaxID=133385 RepID=A0A2T9YJJ3_9FUNG|nr:hypothetical protein BB561_003770 [Smittium simulii]